MCFFVFFVGVFLCVFFFVFFGGVCLFFIVTCSGFCSIKLNSNAKWNLTELDSFFNDARRH